MFFSATIITLQRLLSCPIFAKFTVKTRVQHGISPGGFCSHFAKLKTCELFDTFSNGLEVKISFKNKLSSKLHKRNTKGQMLMRLSFFGSLFWEKKDGFPLWNTDVCVMSFYTSPSVAPMQAGELQQNIIFYINTSLNSY